MGRMVQGIRRRFVRRQGPRPLILMYHRVATPAVDPWGLAVHPDRFETHLDVLRLRRTPLAMSELVRRFHDRSLPDDAVAVTFDDGYADNVTEARPRLAAGDVPATIFLAAGAVGQEREFWWDEVARAILGRHDALDCEVAMEGVTCRIAFPAADRLTNDDRTWRAWQEPRTERQRAFMDVWSRLRRADAADREDAMVHFRQATQTPPPSHTDLPMTAHDVEQNRAGQRVRNRRPHAHAPGASAARSSGAAPRDPRRQAAL